MNITAICKYLNNYFPPLTGWRDNSYIVAGNIQINDNIITGVEIPPNQYIRIVGSVHNDKVIQYGVDELTDEEFTGAIWLMYPPVDFLELCEEINRYKEKLIELNGTNKGYLSESFGGYSYQLGVNVPEYFQDWENNIKSRLNQYRKL